MAQEGTVPRIRLSCFRSFASGATWSPIARLIRSVAAQLFCRARYRARIEVPDRARSRPDGASVSDAIGTVASAGYSHARDITVNPKQATVDLREEYFLV